MKEIKYRGHYMSVTEQVNDDGHVYERVTIKPGVRVFPWEENKILLIKEYRHHEKQDRWKCVSGWMDKEGLNALETAKEELREEVGMGAEEWEIFYYDRQPNATICDEVTFFVARDLYSLEQDTTNPDHDVVLETKWVTLDGLWTMVDEQDIWWDRDTLVAIEILRLYEQNNPCA